MSYVIDYKDAVKKDKQRFSGLREIVWQRDNYECLGCGMTMEEHIEKWGKRLTVNHINGLGRNSATPDNTLDNLETLCLKVPWS